MFVLLKTKIRPRHELTEADAAQLPNNIVRFTDVYRIGRRHVI